jgi:hypothetical protein
MIECATPLRFKILIEMKNKAREQAAGSAPSLNGREARGE